MAAKAEQNILSFRVNGAPVSVHDMPRLSLLMALRHDIALRGTRIGCGQGNCGACTVLLDGRAVQSCTMPLENVAGHDVTTIEGLDEQGLPGRVRQVFLEEQAAQCGYCTNGIIMTIVGLLTRDPPASRHEMIETLDERHLCRCGTQLRILRALDRLLAELRTPGR